MEFGQQPIYTMGNQAHSMPSWEYTGMAPQFNAVYPQVPSKGSKTLKNRLGEASATLTTAVNSPYGLILLFFLLIVPLLQLVFGSIYLNRCTINSNIPIYLIVAGSFGVFTVLILFFLGTSIRCYLIPESKLLKTIGGCCGIFTLLFFLLLMLFLFSWFIVGSVWVFQVRPDVQYVNLTLNTYCDGTLYKFAFAILIIQYSMIGVFCLICIVCACFAMQSSHVFHKS